jgi:hypothetical protein
VVIPATARAATATGATEPASSGSVGATARAATATATIATPATAAATAAAKDPHRERRRRNWPRPRRGSRINGGQQRPRPGRQRQPRRSQPRQRGENTGGSGPAPATAAEPATPGCVGHGSGGSAGDSSGGGYPEQRQRQCWLPGNSRDDTGGSGPGAGNDGSTDRGNPSGRKRESRIERRPDWPRLRRQPPRQRRRQHRSGSGLMTLAMALPNCRQESKFVDEK